MVAGIKIASGLYSDRAEHLRHGIDASTHCGIEFGALNWPVYRPGEADIKFVDFASTEELKRNSYASDPSQIVDVDYIWTGSGSLVDIIGGYDRFDFAIASHVIEHVPNMLGWLRGIYDVLKPGGRLNLAIPDKRFTFDAERTNTTIAELVEADLLNLRMPSIRQIFDHIYMIRQIEPGARWHEERPVTAYLKMSGPKPLEAAYERVKTTFETGAYHDVHCSVFTPSSFLNVFEDATALGLIRFYLDDFVTTGPGDSAASGFEFFVSLVKAIDPASRAVNLLERVAAVRESLRVAERHFHLLASDAS